MRCVVTAFVLLTVMILGIYPACAKASTARQAKGGTVSSAGESMLTMVYIRTASPGALKQLRAMHIDIVRVRSDPERPADENSLDGGIIIEAVVPTDILPKLKAMGFDVSEFLPELNSQDR